ncbi:MAG: hypothetical protein IKJ52_06185 [Muribaculaceae bacterium]|nr:hypothetical protein [Muribaculaceae bacterium]
MADALTQVRVFTDARLVVEVVRSYPGGIATLNPRLLHIATLSRASHAFALEKVLSDTNNLKRKSASKHV